MDIFILLGKNFVYLGKKERELTRLGRSTARYPATSFGIHFLHLIIFDRCTTIVLRSLPLQFASLFVHVRNLKRTFWRHRFVRNRDLHRDRIPSRRVSRRDRIIAAVVSDHGTNAELGVVLGIVDLHLSVGVQGNSAVSPLDVRRRFTDHVNVESQQRAGRQRNIPQIAPIDLGCHCRSIQIYT